MSSFKALLLKRDLIPVAVDEFAAGRSVDGPRDKGKYEEYTLSDGDTPPALLHVYHRDDGTVTLNPRVGKNQDLSVALATFVAEKCKELKLEQRPLSLKKLQEEQFESLLNVLREYGYTVEQQPHKDAVRYKVGRKADVVYLHRYTTGRFLMQGAARVVYSMVVDSLAQLCPEVEELVQSQLDVFQVDEITAEGSLRDLEQLIPAAYHRMGDAVRCMLAPSLSLIRLKIELPDYTVFVMPALRGLEGYMKQVMLEHDIEVNSKEGWGGYFQGAKLKSGVAARISSPGAVCGLEKCYGILCKHRNGLFHADANPELSRLIDKPAEARDLVYEVLNTIEIAALAECSAIND